MFRNALTVINEMYEYRKTIFRLSLFDYKLVNKDSYLGWLWSVINPIIQIGTYWFVFGIGIRNNRPVGDIPFLPWMLCGLVPWFFWNQGVTRGAASIFSKAATVLRMNYPVVTIPLESLLVDVYEHMMIIVVLIAMLLFFGIRPTIYWLNLIYYTLCEVIILLAISLITSALTMIARDFQKLLGSVMRLWFYMTPILWSTENLPAWVQQLLKLNPALYVTEGFRNSILYETPFYQQTWWTLYFWVLTGILFLIGTTLQVNNKDRYLDMI